MLMSALERVLRSNGITRGGADVVLVACSGGVDSVALAHAAVALLGGRRVVLGHVDHAVRPGSAADAQAILAFAETLGVGARVDRLEPGPDDEARLREGRYAALERQRMSEGAVCVLTAHTQDDQAETVLMGLLRSASPGALTGIPETRGRVIRPLLSVSRAELERYVARHRLEIREDPTNREPRYLRNRVRKELLPLLETRYRPRLRPRLAALAARLARALVPSPSAPPPSSSPHPLSPWLGGRMWLKMERLSWSGGPVPDGTSAAAFDVEQVETPRIRLCRAGDRMRPFGMVGHRKLRDLLRERGVPVNDRPVVPIVVDADDRVLWLPGIGRSAVAPISGTTREVWWFSIGQDHELQACESRATLGGAIDGKT